MNVLNESQKAFYEDQGYLLLEGFVGDPLSECTMMVYSDASYSDDTENSKSTSAAFLALVGSNTFAPITAICTTAPATLLSTGDQSQKSTAKARNHA